ncbi:hypothetical protein KM043_006564 [Ampulex compressa]|nr:hypothetical protein KM043_006564 [Ampulex compressa]
MTSTLSSNLEAKPRIPSTRSTELILAAFLLSPPRQAPIRNPTLPAAESARRGKEAGEEMRANPMQADVGQAVSQTHPLSDLRSRAPWAYNTVAIALSKSIPSKSPGPGSPVASLGHCCYPRARLPRKSADRAAITY